jgi:preprotein translocase subunit Sec63
LIDRIESQFADDPFLALGIEHDDDEATIKRSYRKLALAYVRGAALERVAACGCNGAVLLLVLLLCTCTAS